jgi:exosortase E/protease (VPEID-CTERM system)
LNSLETASAFVISTAARRKSELALVALLIGELLYLTVTLDTQPLIRIDSGWTVFIGWAPQYLRLAIAVCVVTLLIGRRRLIVAVTTPLQTTAPADRVRLLAVHGAALLTFASVSAVLFAAGPGVAAHPAPWAFAWFLAALVTIASWALAVFPLSHWRGVMRTQARIVALGATGGTAVWAAGFVTEALWKNLARYTFAVVTWMLRGIYPDVVSIPERLVVGTSSFRVAIAPSCSGFEGVGLIVAFLGLYLYMQRRELRFPGALVLLPVGAVAIWTLNAVRIVALVVIGTTGWREVALGGFHSQAGWLIFNAVGLAFVAVIDRGGYYRHEARGHAAARADAGDATTAFLGPFVAILAASMLTGAFSAGLDWLYPVRVVAAALVLLGCWQAYTKLDWTGSIGAVAIGAGTFAVWMLMLPAGLAGKDGWPAALHAASPAWAALWLAVRVIGYVLIAPVAEELAFRGYAMRRLIRADIDSVPVGSFSWPSFVLSSLLFGLFHGRLWLAGTVAGMAFAGALYRRRSLGDAVLAHATTNALIACYVFATGHWSVWS